MMPRSRHGSCVTTVPFGASARRTRPGADADAGVSHFGLHQSGDSPHALALACGIDAEGLDQTLRVFNASARHAEEPQSQRGSDAYQRFNGAADQFPDPCIAPA